MNGDMHPAIAQRRRLAAYHAARLNAMHVAERERILREWSRPSKADETNKARWEFVAGIVLWAAFMGITSWVAGWLP